MMIQVASHQVQLAALVEACKRRQLLSRTSLVSQVCTLGESFMVGQELWTGLAVLSPDALFLLKVARKDDSPSQRPESATDANLEFCTRPLPTVRYTELPLPLVEDQGWPKPPALDCEVAILLREETRQVRAIPFSTEVEFYSESPRIRVSCSSIGPNMAADRLHRSGWIKNTQPAPVTAIKPMPMGMRRPKYLVLAGVLALALATVIAIQLDSMSTQLTLLLCMPILALIAYIALKHTGRWLEAGERK